MSPNFGGPMTFYCGNSCENSIKTHTCGRHVYSAVSTLKGAF